MTSSFPNGREHMHAPPMHMAICMLTAWARNSNPIVGKIWQSCEAREKCDHAHRQARNSKRRHGTLTRQPNPRRCRGAALRAWGASLHALRPPESGLASSTGGRGHECWGACWACSAATGACACQGARAHLLSAATEVVALKRGAAGRAVLCAVCCPFRMSTPAAASSMSRSAAAGGALHGVGGQRAAVRVVNTQGYATRTVQLQGNAGAPANQQATRTPQHARISSSCAASYAEVNCSKPTQRRPVLLDPQTL